MTLESKRTSSYLNLAMTLLTILGVMDVIFLMTYRKPSDGAVWESRDDGLVVARVLRDVETPLLVGDRLRQMDDIEVRDLPSYEENLFQFPIGSKHLYTVIRDESFFEPWVVITGLREKPEAYLFFALSGFIYLLFAFLIVGQNIPHRDKRNMIFLALSIYCSFIFFRTDLLTPMDWVAFILNSIGISFLGSFFLNAILSKMAWKKWFFVILGILHWGLSSLLFLLLVVFLLGGHQIGSLKGYGLGDLQRFQQIWTIGLCIVGLLLTVSNQKLRKHWESMTWVWLFSFIPLLGYMLKLNYPFDAVLAATFPAFLPIALFFEWNRTYRMFLEGAGRQILIYSSILLALFLGFFIFLGSFYQLLGGRMSSETQLFLSSFGMVLAAIAFTPLKTIIENFWNKIVYGERLESLKNLMDVGLINRANTSLTEFFTVILEKINRGFGIQTLDAFVFNRGRNAFYDVTGKQLPIRQDILDLGSRSDDVLTAEEAGLSEVNGFYGHDLIRPMRINEIVVAFLHLSNGEEPISLSLEENRLLKNLINHCEVLLENIELYRDAHDKAQRIEKLREFNESIIESSQVGMVAVDEMGLIVSCNQAFLEITGFAIENPVGLRFHYLLEEVKIERNYIGKNGEVIEGLYKTPKGLTRLLELQKTPLKARDNTIYGTLYLVDDIKDKKEIQEKMMQQEKLASIGLLAAGVAHEINTPLTGIQSYAQMLVQDDIKDDQKELVQQVLKQSDRAGRIVRELLDFSRKDNAPFDRVNLNLVMEQAMSLMAHTFRKNQIEPQFDAPDTEVIIRGNSNQLQQVFINIMVNAIDAMEKGGTLTIQIRQSHHFATVIFNDSGAGMDQEVVNRIFDPFFTTKEIGKGTGLGLSMVYNILREHNAEISVDSKLTVGTKMVVRFPLLVE